MLTLHHLENSRSQRILWLLEELGVDYEIKRYERDPKTNLAPESLKAIHPLGKSPLLTDGDTVVAESAVIINYLINQYGASKGLIPGVGTEAARQCEYWMHYSEGSLMPYLVLSLIVTKIKTSPMPFFARPIARAIANQLSKGFVSPNVISNLTYIENHLAQNEWFAGSQMTGADFQMSFPLEAALTRAPKEAPLEHIRAWVEKVHARPAYQAALEKGGEYAYA